MELQSSAADYLDQAEQAKLLSLRQTDPHVAEVLSQVERILASQTFKRVQGHARDFLAFVVERKLLGQERRIKEKNIAIHVFHEPPDYNPAGRTAKIRVAAGNLRQKLVEYYEIEGRSDPIEITLPNFGYVPEIEDRRISIGIGRFENWNPGGVDRLLCAVISDELVHELAKAGVIRVAPVRNFKTLDHPPLRYCVRGSLESLDDVLRLNVSVSDLQAGRVVVAESFEGRREHFLKLSHRVATAIAAVLMPRPKKLKPTGPLRRPPARETAHGNPRRRCLPSR